jgi:hypothetical protein
LCCSTLCNSALFLPHSINHLIIITKIIVVFGESGHQRVIELANFCANVPKQNLLVIIEHELDLLDLTVNCSKSFCLWIGQHYKLSSSEVRTSDSNVSPWVNEVRYLSICIAASAKCKCLYLVAKKLFCCSVNAIPCKLDYRLTWRSSCI